MQCLTPLPTLPQPTPQKRRKQKHTGHVLNLLQWIYKSIAKFLLLMSQSSSYHDICLQYFVTYE